MRQLETEAMLSEDEVLAYDLLARKYLGILHAGFIETVINLSPAKGSFLDVGTGTGWIAIGVAKHNPGAEVWGVDLSETMLKVARSNAEKEGVIKRTHFILGDASRLPFDDKTFDSVFCHNMLHHLPEPLHMVNDMARVAKEDGALIIRDLLRHSRLITELHVQLLGLPYNRLMKKEYRDSILAALSKDEWRRLFDEAGLKQARITRQFVTHMSIEKPSGRRAHEYVKVPTPFYFKPFKSLYVSNPSS